MKKIILTLTLLIGTIAANAAAIGTWTAYMAYNDITEIEQAGTTLYVLASDGLFSYNTSDQSVQTYDKVNALSDCDISHIKWCASAKRLIIIYKNNNIDLLATNGTVTNISDYYNKTMTEDKTVNSINTDGYYAYLSTGFGIIKMNVNDAEISDTYNLGFNVNYSYISDNKIYAASSSQGLYAASTSANLLDKSKWTRVGEYVAKSNTVDPKLLTTAQKANPGGPKYNEFGFLLFANNMLYSCNGNSSFNNATIQVLKNGEWNIYSDDNISDQTGVSYTGLYCLDYDPTNINHLFAGGRNGLYEYLNGKFINYYDYQNSPIEIFDAKDTEYQLVTGIKFDVDGNLWCLNSQAPTQSIIELDKNSVWSSHTKSDLMKLNDGGFKNKSLGYLSGMILDSRGLIWFVNNHWTIPSLYCYQSSTDALNSYTSFVNEDGTTVSLTYARCVTEDKDNNIWLGTNVGPLMLENSQITSGGTTFTQVKVPRNDGTNYADYLLSGVDITCIAVDGGNRKWFGTNGNGVYMISSDNLSQIHHFTASNSNLFSDIIESIAINVTTGEVFFGTDKGLCSYMSDATTASDNMNKDDVYAYPNPVKPDYNGLITVKGLSYDADIKIVTSNGVIVNEGQSNGGLYTWDGCDSDGKKVASGVYMVLTAKSDGSKGTVCKIAIVR